MIDIFKKNIPLHCLGIFWIFFNQFVLLDKVICNIIQYENEELKNRTNIIQEENEELKNITNEIQYENEELKSRINKIENEINRNNK